MREIYLPAFEAAVVKGQVDSVMDSYNLINGVARHAERIPEPQNSERRVGLRGRAHVRLGCDLRRRRRCQQWPRSRDAEPAVHEREERCCPPSKVARLKNPPSTTSCCASSARIALRLYSIARSSIQQYSTFSVADRAVALQGALESITLLKNEGNTLPLDPTKIKTIAMIGPDAWPAVAGGGGSSEADPISVRVSIVTGIANLLGPKCMSSTARGLPEMGDIFRNTQWDSRRESRRTYPSKTSPDPPRRRLSATLTTTSSQMVGRC